MPECGEITGLEKTKRGRYSVFVDGEFLWSLDGETLLKSRVRRALLRLSGGTP